MKKETIDTVERLLKEGKSYAEISKITGRTMGSLRYIKSWYLKHLGRIHLSGKDNPSYKDGRCSDPNYHKKYRDLNRNRIRLRNMKNGGEKEKYFAVYRKTAKAKVARIKSNAKYRKKNTDKYRAYSTVGNALNSGLISKEPCKICGSIKNIHAHHDDYSKPLIVEWLCHDCHMFWHQLLNEWKRQEESGRWERQIKSYLSI